MKKSFSSTSAFYAMKDDYIKYLGIVAQNIVKHRRRLRSLSEFSKSELDFVYVASLILNIMFVCWFHLLTVMLLLKI